MSWCTSQQSNKKTSFARKSKNLGGMTCLGRCIILELLHVNMSGVGNETGYIPHRIHVWNTLLGTNISPEKSILKMIFLFPRWDTLISWRVSTYIELILMANLGKYTSPMDPSWKKQAVQKHTKVAPKNPSVSGTSRKLSICVVALSTTDPPWPPYPGPAVKVWTKAWNNLHGFISKGSRSYTVQPKPWANIL